MITLRGRTVVPGYAEGEALVSAEPLPGWGGIDPAAGRVIESRHVLNGQTFSGRILVFPSAKGSSGWSGFFQATRLLGTAPLAMLITRISTKSALGAVVTRVPALTDFDADPCLLIRTGDWVRVDATHGLVAVLTRGDALPPGDTPDPGGPEPPAAELRSAGHRSELR